MIKKSTLLKLERVVPEVDTHSFPSIHILISGLIEYQEEHIENNQEHIKKIQAPAIINTPANFAHLIIALEDSIFIEIFEKSYEATNYNKYRKIVNEKLG